MKYIKEYENFDISPTVDYEIGDYVCLDSDYFVDHLERFGKIIERKPTGFNYGKIVYGFDVLFVTGEIMWVNSSMILRKLNQSEIDKLDMEFTSNKYNI